MIPTWVLSTLVIIAGCIFACFVGSSLPDYGYFGIYIVSVSIICTLAAITNNFPMLLAMGVWCPFELPIAMFRSFPTLVLVISWMGLVLFFRLCLTGTVPYVRSFNLLFMIAFAWVPIRFFMNPIYKLGASVEGGSGVSGATPYAMYAIAAVVLLVMGFILTTRETMVAFLRWSFVSVLVVGIGFTICAFIPATGPWLYSMGIFPAGEIAPGILRLVQIPAYGLFILQAALCPNLFRLKARHSLILVAMGLFMLILGGNRGTVIQALVALPIILVLRRSTHVLAIVFGIAVLAIVMLRFTVEESNASDLSPLARSLGVFDSKIDRATGGDLSLDWRYGIWQSGIEKIMEHPLTGKGFGNLPQHLDPNSADVQSSTDFEVVLAGGEAHNGYVTAAYGFGIPFMAALTIGLLGRMLHQMRSALMVDKHDRELRDLYALVASMYPSYLIGIYVAFDMSVTGLWIYVAMGFILDNLARSSLGDASQLAQTNALSQSSQYASGYWAYAPGAKVTSKRK